MGFTVDIQVDYRQESFSNDHAIDQQTHGKAIFAFLSGLLLYCGWSNEDEDTGLQDVIDCYRRLDQSQTQSFCDVCQPLLDCMWGDGGNPTEYRADEYELFQTQNPHWHITAEQFQNLVQSYSAHWQPIGDVLQAVRFLLAIFHQTDVEDCNGFFSPEYTRLDLEALEADLNFLIKQGHTVVRLNFS